MSLNNFYEKDQPWEREKKQNVPFISSSVKDIFL